MIWKIWAAVAALVAGIVLASFPGGSLSPWAKIVVAFALLVGVVWTIATTFSIAGTGWRESRALEIQHDPGPLLSDRETIERLERLLPVGKLDWLRLETFGAPWRDEHVAPLRDLLQFSAGNIGIFDSELDRAVRDLIDAATAFLRLYDADTVADPVTRDATWRMIGHIGPDGEVASGGKRDQRDSQRRLMAAAKEICDSFDVVSMISKHKLGID